MKYKNQVAELPVMPISKNGISKPTNILDLITPQIWVHSSVSITPKMAEELLTLNVYNRPLTKKTVDRYAYEMKNNRWLFSGNTLKFSSELKLQDGQHSLHAVVSSGTTQIFNIQTGLTPLSFTVMDTGKVRSAGDVIAMQGYMNYYAIGAAIKTTIFFESTGKLKNNLSYVRISNFQVEEFTHRTDMPLMVECIAFAELARQKKRTVFLAVSTWGFVYFILSKKNTTQATEFVNLLSKGENISMTKNAAIYLLREKLIGFGDQHSKEFKKGGAAVTELKVRYIFNAWNAWRKNENITKIQVNPKEPVEQPI